MVRDFGRPKLGLHFNCEFLLDVQINQSQGVKQEATCLRFHELANLTECGAATRNQVLWLRAFPHIPQSLHPRRNVPHPRATNPWRHFLSEKKEMTRSV